jgi:hypothetical protein
LAIFTVCSAPPFDSGYPANPDQYFGVDGGRGSAGGAAIRPIESPEMFLVAADFGGEGVQGDAQVLDLGGELGEGSGFSSVGAVFFDDGS